MRTGGIRMGRNRGGGFVWEYKGHLLHLHGREIYYLHSEQRKIFIHTAKQTYEVGGKLDEEEEFLNELPIVRTHYSYLVHIRHLERVEGNEVIMKNGERIPVSERYRKQVHDTVMSCFPRRGMKGH